MILICLILFKNTISTKQLNDNLWELNIFITKNLNDLIIKKIRASF